MGVMVVVVVGGGTRASAQMARCHGELVSTCSRATLSRAVPAGPETQGGGGHITLSPSPWQLMSPCARLIKEGSLMQGRRQEKGDEVGEGSKI